jgi:spore germination protein KC
MDKNKKTCLLVLIVGILFMITGCWDNRDVTELNFITAMGLDKTPEGSIEITIEMPRPSLMGKGQGGGGGTESKEKPVTIVSAQGDTTLAAARKLLEKIEKPLLLPTHRLLFVGEELAKSGLMEVLDFFERKPESNLTTQILVVKGAQIKKIMEAESEQEKIPSTHIARSITTNQEKLGSSTETRVLDLLRIIGSSGQDALVPTIEISEEKEELKVKDMLISGTAIFRKDRLVGYLSAIQTRAWLLAENKAKGSIFTVANPLAKDQKVSFEAYKGTGQKKVELLDGKPKLMVKLEVYGGIGESQGGLDLTQPAELALLQTEIEKTIKEEVASTISTAQEYQTDIFGFGEIMRRKYRSEWPKMKDDWPELFSKASYEIEVETKISRSGYIRQGTKSE